MVSDSSILDIFGGAKDLSIDISSNDIDIIKYQKEEFSKIFRILNTKVYEKIFERILSDLPSNLSRNIRFPFISDNEIISINHELQVYQLGHGAVETAAYFVALLLYTYGNLTSKKTKVQALKSKRIFKHLHSILTIKSPKDVDKFVADFAPVEYLRENPIPPIREAKFEELSEPKKTEAFERMVQLATNSVQGQMQSFADNQTDAIKQSADQITKELRGDVQSIIADALKGTQAEGILRQAFTLWDTKEETHRRNFKYGIILFICLIIGSTITLWLEWDPIKGVINDTANGTINKDSVTIGTAQLLSRIVLISLPFATMLWILRAVLRWANLNLSLAGDAAQRSVMAQTYVNLLANGNIDQDKDREIMLSALFRPLPGVREIDIAPTSIIDIVNPGKPRGK